MSFGVGDFVLLAAVWTVSHPRVLTAGATGLVDGARGVVSMVVAVVFRATSAAAFFLASFSLRTFFAGIAAGTVGALIGSWAGCW